MDIVEQRKKAYFGAKFTYFLSEWMKSNHKTQHDFCVEANVSKNIVTAWKKGERFPRDAQMQKICETFGVEEGAFLPFFDYEKEVVYNSRTKERSEQLQKYADEKGLKDKWYTFFINQKEILRKFPFHQDYCVDPMTDDDPSQDEQFDLQKFQFEDDFGHRVMLCEEDIDFLVYLQNMNKTQVRFLLYVEREKIDRQRVVDCVDSYLELLPVDRDEVMKRLYAFDLTDQTGKITERMIKDTICQIAEEKGIKPQITSDEMQKAISERSALRTDQLKRMREYHRIRGKTETEIDQILRRSEEIRRNNVKEVIKKIQSEGYLIDDDNTDKEV